MERQLKFRAWNRMVNRWQYFVLEDLEKQKTPIQWHILEIMQFTGLLDKNGKEIYERDICQSAEPSLDYILEGNGKTELNLIGEISISVKGVVFGYGYAYDFPALEVIGNIYENPELIK